MTALVLVVDDISCNAKVLEAKLRAEYFEVITCANGPDALARVDDSVPDIVLLDVMMPGMDGFEVCRRIKGAVRQTLTFLQFGANFAPKLGECPCKQSRLNATGSRPTSFGRPFGSTSASR